jgi:tricorn protease
MLAVLVCTAGNLHAEGTKLLRFPNIWHNRIVFSYAGDLWSVDSQGGAATRLTSGPGLKLFARYSPDGNSIAFTAQYGGDEQVYVMPSGGGVPQQLTFYPATGPLPDRWGYDNQVYGWTPDGNSILFRSLRDAYTLSASRLYTVPRAGGPATPLPMPLSGAPAAYRPTARESRIRRNGAIFAAKSVTKVAGPMCSISSTYTILQCSS